MIEGEDVTQSASILELDSLTAEAVEGFAGRSGSGLGWLFLFILLIDLLLTASGASGISLLLFSWIVLPFMDVGDASAGWWAVGVVSFIQLFLAISAYHLIWSSAWRVHLGFSLRESFFWGLLNPSFTRDLRSVEPEQKLRTLIADVILFLMGLYIATPLKEPVALFFTGRSGQGGGATFFITALLFALAFGIVISAILRRWKDDRSIPQALLLTLVVAIIVWRYAPPASQILDPISPAIVTDLRFWEVMAASVILCLIACLAITRFDQVESVSVKLVSSEPSVHFETDPALQRVASKSFRASFLRVRAETVLVYSQRWDNQGTAIVYGDTTHLPVIARHFHVWNLTNLARALSGEIDFEGVLAGGLFVLKADFEARPSRQLTKGSFEISTAAMDFACERLLDTTLLKDGLGEYALRYAERVVNSYLLEAMGMGETKFSEGNIEAQIKTIRAGLKHKLGALQPSNRAELQKLAFGDNMSIDEKREEVLTQALSALTGILELFDGHSLTDAVNAIRESSEEIVREIAHFPSGRAGASIQEISPSDDEFDFASADFVIDLLQISIKKVSIEPSPTMVALRQQAESVMDEVSSEIERLRDMDVGKDDHVFDTVMSNPRFTKLTTQYFNKPKPAVRANDPASAVEGHATTSGDGGLPRPQDGVLSGSVGGSHAGQEEAGGGDAVSGRPQEPGGEDPGASDGRKAVRVPGAPEFEDDF